MMMRRKEAGPVCATKEKKKEPEKKSVNPISDGELGESRIGSETLVRKEQMCTETRSNTSTSSLMNHQRILQHHTFARNISLIARSNTFTLITWSAVASAIL